MIAALISAVINPQISASFHIWPLPGRVLCLLYHPAAVDIPATEIEYAALTWDDPEVDMRQLSLEDVVEQLAYDFLSDTHGGWENNDGAYGEFCFDAAARCIHLEFNEMGWLPPSPAATPVCQDDVGQQPSSGEDEECWKR